MSELDLYIKNQDELLKKYEGKIIALRHGAVLGEYASKLDALRAMRAMGLKNGEYFIIRCTPGDSEYTVRLMPLIRRSAAMAQANA